MRKVKEHTTKRICVAAGLVCLAVVPFGSAHAESLGARQDSRLSGNPLNQRMSSSRLAVGKIDARDRDEALQAVIVKKASAQDPQQIRGVSSEVRAQKTRRVVAGQ